MARFMIIDENNQLANLSQDLENLGHVKVQADTRITEPFLRRKNEWGPLKNDIADFITGAIIMTPFFRNGVATAPCLLAPIRKSETNPDVTRRIKTILIADNQTPLVIRNLLEPPPINRVLLLGRTKQDTNRLVITIRQAIGNRQGNIEIIDDDPDVPQYFSREISPLFPSYTINTSGFDGGYARPTNPPPPAVIVTDIVELIGGNFTGVGLYYMVRSTPTMTDIPIILYTIRADDNQTLQEWTRPFDGAFTFGPTTKQDVHNILIG